MSTFSDLPITVLLEIFSRVGDSKILVKTLPKICKTWRRTMFLFWKKQVKSIDFYVFSDQLFSIDTFNGRKFSLHVKNKGKIDDFAFKYFFDCRCSLERLKSVSLNQCWNYIHLESFFSILPNLRQIQVLKMKIFHFEISLAELMTNVIGNFTNLNEICIKYVDYDQLGNVRNRKINDLLKAVFLSCKNLKVVNISLSFLPNVDDVWKYLKTLPVLEEFFWEKFNGEVCGDYVKDLLTVLQNCSKKLNSIGLTCEIDPKFPLDGIGCKSILAKLAENKCMVKFYAGLGLPILNRDRLSRALGLDEMLMVLVDFRDLRELTLENVNFSDSLISSILQQLALRLIKFTLRMNENVGDSFFGQFRKGMSRLECLALDGYFGDDVISERGLVEFVTKCPNLHKLELFSILHLNMNLFVDLLRNARNNVESSTSISSSLNVVIKPNLKFNELENLKSTYVHGLKVVDFYQDVTVCRLLKPRILRD